MNKIWAAVVVVFVFIIGILGLNYMNLDKTAGAFLFNKDVTYTDEELQELYEEYNITENDLKFARGELPNYLEGTILYSDLRVIVSETGEPPEGVIEGEHYDVVISEQEMSKIIEEAREDYIEKYGVDPANPKLDEVKGYLIPVQEAKRLVSLDMVREME